MLILASTWLGWAQTHGQHEEHAEPLVVSSQTQIKMLAEALATPQRQIVLSTFMVPQELDATLHHLQVAMLTNFAENLHKTGVLAHTLMVVDDRYSAAYALTYGIPCVVDEVTPSLYPTRGSMGGGRPMLDKWLWCNELLLLNLTVLYMDWDVVVHKDPFSVISMANLDFQALSDHLEPPDHLGQIPVRVWSADMVAMAGMRAMSGTTPALKQRRPSAHCPQSRNALQLPGVAQQAVLHDTRPITPCPPYGSERWVQACLLEHFSGPSSSRVFASPCPAGRVTPCASTGLWCVVPTPASIDFIGYFVKVSHSSPW